MPRLIDADKLRDKIIWLPHVNGIPATVNHNRPLIDIAQACTEIDNAPTVGGWVPVSERLPECEVEVLILTKRNIITTAMYEDGKMTEDKSMWNWTDVDLIYDKNTDESYLPEGWWEYRHFNPDDVYNNAVDEKVIAWQQLPNPYENSDLTNTEYQAYLNGILDPRD